MKWNYFFKYSEQIRHENLIEMGKSLIQMFDFYLKFAKDDKTFNFWFLKRKNFMLLNWE